MNSLHSFINSATGRSRSFLSLSQRSLDRGPRDFQRVEGLVQPLHFRMSLGNLGVGIDPSFAPTSTLAVCWLCLLNADGLRCISGHLDAGGRGPRITCNHPPGTSMELHPLRPPNGISRRPHKLFFATKWSYNRNSTGLMHARRESYTSRLGSTNTSLVEGTWSPAPGEPLTPNKDEATALAVEHAKRQLHRLNHAARALPYNLRGSEAAFAHARDHHNAFVFWDHLPPTSPVTTTNRARPSRWHNCLSFNLWASELDRRWHQPCVGDCRPSGVVTPLWRQLPIGTSRTKSVLQQRLPDGESHSCGGAISRSLITFVDTLAPPSRNI